MEKKIRFVEVPYKEMKAFFDSQKEFWKNNEECPKCGMRVDPHIKANETGYNYCSRQCAISHVNENEPEGGY